MDVVEKSGLRGRVGDDSCISAGGARSASAHEPVGVLVVGPPLDTIGGMTSVVRQTVSLSYSGRYTAHHLPTCHARNEHETGLAKLARHWRQVGVLRRMVRRTRARLVHLHTCSGFSFYRSVVDMMIVRRMGCRTILHIHGASFDEFFTHSGRVARWLISRSLSFADVVVSLSESWRTTLRQMAPHARVAVIENAVEMTDPAAAVTPRGDDKRCHFVVLARMDDWKGIDDALAAAALLNDRHILFRMTLAGPAGSAGDAETLTQKIKTLDLTDCAQYVGPVRGGAKTELLHSCDVFLQPSHHEGMPISVLEACAYGLPVVATAVGAVPEVIERNVQGILVPAKAPEALADAMTKMVRDRELRSAMGVAARRLARERFSLARFDRDLTALYDGLLGASASADVSTTSTADSSLYAATEGVSPVCRIPEIAS